MLQGLLWRMGDRSPWALGLTGLIAVGFGGTLIYQANRKLDTPDVPTLPQAQQQVSLE